MLYSCTHMAVVGVKGLMYKSGGKYIGSLPVYQHGSFSAFMQSQCNHCRRLARKSVTVTEQHLMTVLCHLSSKPNNMTRQKLSNTACLLTIAHSVLYRVSVPLQMNMRIRWCR